MSFKFFTHVALLVKKQTENGKSGSLLLKDFGIVAKTHLELTGYVNVWNGKESTEIWITQNKEKKKRKNSY